MSLDSEKALSVSATEYDAQSLGVGIVHIGLGAFVRAHCAVYLEKLLNVGAAKYGMCAANIRSNAAIVDTLAQQDGRYTVAEYAAEGSIRLRQVSSIREALFAGGQRVTDLLERLKDPAIAIVSLTVTEKGYFYDAAAQTLKVDSADIQHDIANPEKPKTAIGILVAALRFCYLHDQAPFTVLSCDNMPHNGASTRAAVMQLAAQTDVRFAQWVGEQVRFPSTMVDRIVPAVTDDTIAEVNRLLSRAKAPWGCDDRAPIACESFSQWVIEDNFSKGRPDFARAGAEMVTDVAPWEEMKLRMLNGSHSIIAYLGCLSGYDTVAECMNDTALVALIRRYMLEEAAPTLAMPASVNIEAYASALLARFSNVSLQHKTRQIAMDGSQKIPQRWLQGVAIKRKQGGLASTTALGFAAWIVYLQRSTQVPGYRVDDPLAATIVPLACSANNPEGVIAFLNQPALKQFALSGYRPWVEAIVLAVAALQHDVKAAIVAQSLNGSAHE